MSGWLAGCVRQDFGTNGGSWTRAPAIIVLHSTEGNSWPGYDGGQSAPHFTIDVRTGERRQHISMDHAARALANAGGGVETNRGGAIQIEIIGTCEVGHAGWLFVPGMDDDQTANLHRLIADIAEAEGIPLDSGVRWLSYPDSYGANGVRLSGGAWNSYRGVLGHQHVPENDHGDPGNIDIAAVLGDDTMGDVNIVGMSGDVAQVVSKAIWERYKPEGDNMATIINQLQNDVAAIRDQLDTLLTVMGAVGDDG